MGLGWKKRKNSGFTMVEMLVVVALLIILMAFGFVEVVKRARYLKVTEMDNMARSIYLAAENRAVTLARSGRLTEGSLTSAGGTSLAPPGSASNLCYIKSSSTGLGSFVPMGTIEPALRDASFYIVYDIAAGCVKDVFFDAKTSEENFNAAFSAGVYGLSGPGNFATFYQYWRGSTANTSRQTRADNKIYIGHYGGDAAAPPAIGGSTPGTDPIEVQPIIKIENSQELKVHVQYKRQDASEINGWELEVKLTYGKKTVTLSLDKGVQPTDSDQWSYTLDAVGGPYFKDLVWKNEDSSDMTKEQKEAAEVLSLGKEFTITAKMVKKADGSFTGERANLIATPAILKRANSLFDDASSGKTAIIANLRHLQNLDESFSGVLDKEEAHQVANIEADKLKDNAGNVVQTGYEFHPISNNQLKSYQSWWDSGTKECYSIANLTVTAASANSSPSAGLFATAAGRSDTDKFQFKNIWLINAAVNGGDKPTGGIVGSATNADFNNCRVYWTDTARLEQDGKLAYQISGGTKNTGGLVGELTGGNITMSLAATTIQGNGNVGGLVGKAEDVKIQQSYADCYLKGESANLHAGGLIGEAAGSTELTNVYSSGFIEWTNTSEESSAVAGFCASGKIKVTNGYSGVYYQATGDYAKKLAGGDAQAFGDVDKTNCFAAWGNGSNSGYEGLKNLNLGPAFDSKGNDANSFPYRLGKNSGLGNYEILGIKGLPHYGDWANGNQGGLPIVWVVNGEELQVKIKTKGGGVVGDNAPNCSTPFVKLCYGEKEVVILANKVERESWEIISSTETEVLWKVTLDSLNGPHFKDWWDGLGSPPSSFGGDFSAMASTDNSTWTKKSAKSSSNSLFAGGTVTMDKDKPVSISSGSTAYVENLRHLQNLDQAISKVGESKTAAVQTADIDGGQYAFKPIYNPKLQEYKVQEKIASDGTVLRGEYCDITGLKVTEASSTGKAGAGLFAQVSSTGVDESLKAFQFQNVSLIGAKITSGDAKIPAGALVGSTIGVVTFTNCKVAGNVVTAEDANPTVERSIVTGKGSAGGLVGKAMSGTVEFTGCTGSQVTVRADGKADARGYGGLAGYFDGATIKMNNCRMDGATVQNATVTVKDNAMTAESTEGGFRDCIGGLVGYVNNAASAEFTGCSVGLEENVNVWGADCPKTVVTSSGSQVVFVGGMVGYLKGNATDDNGFQAKECRIVKATVRGAGNRSCVGGLTGFAQGASFTGCTVGDTFNSGMITGNVAIYGSSDYQYPDYYTTISGGTIARVSYNKLGEQVGSGGMIGYAMKDIVLSGCKVAGDVSVKGYKTADHVGGFVGYASSVTGEMLTGCEIKASGEKKPTIESGAGGSGVGAGHVGGMVGFAQPNLELKNCAADGITVKKNDDNVAGLRGVGGLVGFVGTMRYKETYNNQALTIDAQGKAMLTGCSVTGSTSVTGKGYRNRIGGLVGYATAANFRGCEAGVGSGAGRVFVQGLFAEKTNDIKNALEVDRTVFVGGMIGSSASSDSSGAKTTFDKDTDGKVCKVANTSVYGEGPRACVGGMMGLANQTAFANCIVGEAGSTSSVTVSATSMNTNQNLDNNTGGVGGIAGYANSAITFTDCAVINAKIGKDTDAYKGTDKFDAGGIVGSAQNSGTFTRCKVGGNDANENVVVSGARFTGGIAGFVVGQGIFTECKTDQASVYSVNISESAAGGVLGKGTGNTTMERCAVGNTTVNAKNVAGSSTGGKKASAGGLAGSFVGSSTKKIEVKITDCTVSKITLDAVSVSTGIAEKDERIGHLENVNVTEVP